MSSRERQYGSIPSGPRAKTYSGTNPHTGINKFDVDLGHSNHYINEIKLRDSDVKKNYKVINHQGKKKIRFMGESLPSVSDPRLNNVLHYFQRPNKLSKKFPFKQLPQTRFVYDANSIGPPPKTQLVLWDLPINMTISYITNYFKSFDSSPLQDIVFVSDPLHAVPLGIATFKFQGSVEKQEKLAKSLINTIKLQRPKIDGLPLKIDLNDDKSLFLNSKIKLATEALRRREEREKRLRREIEDKRRREEEKRKLEEKKVEERRKAEEKKRLLEENKLINSTLYKFKPNSTILSVKHKNKLIPGIILPENLEKYIKDRPYILIHDRYASTKKIPSQDIKRALNKYDWTRVISDKTGFFIVFNSLTEAERCFVNEDGRKFYEYNLFMELSVPPNFKNDADSLSSTGKSSHDLIDEAANMLIKEFQSFLSKDIRERIIAPTVLDLLSNDKYPEIMKELKAKEAATKAEVKKPHVDKLMNDSLVQIAKHKKSGLPSFRKKKENVKHKTLVPMQHALNYDRDSEDSNDEDEESISRSSTPVTTMKRGYDSATTSVEPEDEPTKKQKTGLRKSLLYDSDDEMLDTEEKVVDEKEVGDEDEDEDEDQQEDEDMEAEVEEEDVSGNESEEIDYTQSEIKYQPTTGGPKTVYPETPCDIFDFDALKSTVKDEEDLKYIRQVLSEENIKSSDININIDYWAWKQLNSSLSMQEIVEDVELIETLKSSLQNSTGSFRSQGYHKIPEKNKIDYLPHRRKLHKPIKTVQHEDEEDDVQKNTNTTTTTKNVQSSRVNRANNRRFAADITAQLGNETEVLSLNALTKRKKPVSFARSAIHNWGLYALEPIGAREMIIEYVGEQIRQQVAENREKSYLKTGIGSSYLFRVDENTVIDATKKGGIARFINHCCNPSCTAKIIKVEGTKRIVIYALRDIDTNEELTYDYKFERDVDDDERIPCLCGAPGCKGYLN